ncbi:MAG: CBS domain-containing protein [Candidatus Nanoarchaeia archaeon]
MKIKNWMNRNIKTTSKDSLVLDAAKSMKQNLVADLVVVENGHPIGILTERDICYKVVAMNKDPQSTKVDDIMTKTLITAHIDDTISEVSRRMGLAKIKQIPIIDDKNTLVGIITSSDLVRVVSHFQRDLDSMVKSK